MESESPISDLGHAFARGLAAVDCLNNKVATRAKKSAEYYGTVLGWIDDAYAYIFSPRSIDEAMLFSEAREKLGPAVWGSVVDDSYAAIASSLIYQVRRALVKTAQNWGRKSDDAERLAVDEFYSTEAIYSAAKEVAISGDLDWLKVAVGQEHQQAIRIRFDAEQAAKQQQRTVKQEQSGNGRKKTPEIKLPDEDGLRDLWHKLSKEQGKGKSDRKIAAEFNRVQGSKMLRQLITMRTRHKISNWKKR